LQENGYLVLRFLAEDLGAHLDEVLDAILRALANRRTAMAIPRDELARRECSP
jgi:very-short-patch-repair endonuclease